MTGNSRNADVGTTTRIGNSGPEHQRQQAAQHRGDHRDDDGLQAQPGEHRTRRDANRFEHREISGAFQRGQVDDGADDECGDDPQQHRNQRDRADRRRHRPHQVVDGACAVDRAIAVGYLRGRAADADRRHDRLTAVTHLLRARDRQKHVGLSGQGGGVIDDADDLH